MSDEIGGLLAGLDAATGMADRIAAVQQAAARGQGLMLYELASALASHIDDAAIPRQPYRGLLEHISRVLALTPGAANAEWAARLASSRSSSRPHPEAGPTAPASAEPTAAWPRGHHWPGLPAQRRPAPAPGTGRPAGH